MLLLAFSCYPNFMRFIKGILIFIVVIGLISGAIYAGKQYLPKNVQNLITQTLGTHTLSPDQLSALQPAAQNILSQAQSAAPQLMQAGNVLGAATNSSGSPSANTQPLPQQAFEYGRYIYCQQVVSDYETRYGKK